MAQNSATIFEDKPQYVYSDINADELMSWIQAPISRESFEQNSQSILIDGIYVQVKPMTITMIIPDTLAQEFSAWDATSDEALLNFEQELN